MTLLCTVCTNLLGRLTCSTGRRGIHRGLCHDSPRESPPRFRIRMQWNGSGNITFPHNQVSPFSFFFLNELKNNSLKRKGGKIWISPFLIGRALSTNHVARFLNALDLGSCDMRLRLQFLFSEQNHPLSFLAQALCLDKFSSTCQRSPLP